MNKSSILAAIALAGTLSATALIPASYAQTATPPAPAAIDAPEQIQVAERGFGMRGQEMRGQGMQEHGMQGHAMWGRGMGGPGAGGFLALACSEDGPALLELRLNALARNVTLDETQQPLYDAFKAAALTAETTYADTCEPMTRPQSGTPADPIANLTQHRANLEAQIVAMDGVLPSLQAFYDSLTDEQKTQLTPQRMQHGDDQQRGSGHRFMAHPGIGQRG